MELIFSPDSLSSLAPELPEGDAEGNEFLAPTFSNPETVSSNATSCKSDIPQVENTYILIGLVCAFPGVAESFLRVLNQ